MGSWQVFRAVFKPKNTNQKHKKMGDDTHFSKAIYF